MNVMSGEIHSATALTPNASQAGGGYEEWHNRSNQRRTKITSGYTSNHHEHYGNHCYVQHGNRLYTLAAMVNVVRSVCYIS